MKQLVPQKLLPKTSLVVWESEYRRYRLHIQTNLWGDLEVRKEWSGKFNRNGSSQTIPVEDQDQALDLVRQEMARRTRHGYRLVRISQEVEGNYVSPVIGKCRGGK